VLGDLLMERPALARGNATYQTLRSDFMRTDLDIWEALERRDQRNLDRMRRINQLSTWRNAVAHQDVPPPSSAQLIRGTDRDVRSLRTWRHSCSALVHDIDAVVNHHMIVLAGRRHPGGKARWPDRLDAGWRAPVGRRLGLAGPKFR
jgi:hypothetical protein